MDSEGIIGYDEELEALMERSDVNGPQRLTFRSEPDRAKRLLRYALARPKIRNPAAFALARFRAEQEAPRETPADEEPREAMDVAALERALAFAREYGAPTMAIAAITAELDAARCVEELASGDAREAA